MSAPKEEGLEARLCNRRESVSSGDLAGFSNPRFKVYNLCYINAPLEGLRASGIQPAAITLPWHQKESSQLYCAGGHGPQDLREIFTSLDSGKGLHQIIRRVGLHTIELGRNDLTQTSQREKFPDLDRLLECKACSLCMCLKITLHRELPRCTRSFLDVLAVGLGRRAAELGGGGDQFGFGYQDDSREFLNSVLWSSKPLRLLFERRQIFSYKCSRKECGHTATVEQSALDYVITVPEVVGKVDTC